MITSAVLEGVKQFMLDELTWTHPDIQLGIRGAGRPVAASGQFYYGIFPTTIQSGDNWTQGLNCYLGYAVAITLRIGTHPDDRRSLLYTGDEGMDDRVCQLVSLLHGRRFDLMCAINDKIPTDRGTLIEPFLFDRADAWPRLEGPDWFSADPNAPDALKYYGWVSEVHFGSGRVAMTQDELVPPPPP